MVETVNILGSHLWSSMTGLVREWVGFEFLLGLLRVSWDLVFVCWFEELKILVSSWSICIDMNENVEH